MPMNYAKKAHWLLEAQRHGVEGLVLGAAGVMLMTAIRPLIPIPILTGPFTTYIPAVAMVSLFCGWKNALAALALCVAAPWIFWLDPSVMVAEHLARSGVFIFVCLLIIWMNWMHIGLLRELAVNLTMLAAITEHERLLLEETAHRSKNLLQIIISMARMSQSSMDELLTRIYGLSRSHDLLLDNKWRSVTMKEMAETHAAQFARDRVAVKGPSIVLKPTAVFNMGMALAELTANSLRHGAMSNGGRVEITWNVESDEMCVCWQEFGVETENNGHYGFGTHVLTKIVPTSMNGSAYVHHEKGGIRWKLTCPLAGNAVG